ncbi:SDR family NAD(P)-dependent oxidoreductase [Acidiferrimicrobium sp. IK]|uniref:SDR family NAD(P)-dependent oxidoreductase n=1 Tax=Acidiferrimicrobium sp. IK TaxID=2871700 RepID=UPI0021CB0D7E|nr:SDR family NAD(P)-dependent oxidoreductase [Acidiferrimicrobium sp. IK]MCU4183268.1 SDR family NAD(P)-dependent oxidoreductase [Acidiferrimicrobium sp. IK]
MSGVALVTGASRGIGRAVAIEAARRGYDVLVGCVGAVAAAEAVAAAITGTGKQAAVCQADLTQVEGLEATVAAARTLGPVTLLVNNAGVTNSGPLGSLDWDRWHATLALNLTAPVWLARNLSSDLAAGRGAVINVGSTGGIVGSVHSLPYAASKAGLIGATKTLARMLAPDVRVNLIAPGITDTDLLQGVTLEQRVQILDGQPLARLGQANEIARVIMDVASWTYTTGQVVVADGGRVM